MCCPRALVSRQLTVGRQAGRPYRDSEIRARWLAGWRARADSRWRVPHGRCGPRRVSDDGEGPVRSVRLSPYLIDATAVTNRQFAAFVRDTGYVTDAERFGWPFVFHLSSAPISATTCGRVSPGCALVVSGRTRVLPRPEGPGSDVSTRPQHPVVHVSWNDAAAYAAGPASGYRPRRSGRWPRAVAWTRPGRVG